MTANEDSLTQCKNEKKQSCWYVYLLLCADNSLYCGICTDIPRRLYEHNFDDKKSAKYTRARRPLRLMYAEAAVNRSKASQREYKIKRYSRQKKLSMIESYQST